MSLTYPSSFISAGQNRSSLTMAFYSHDKYKFDDQIFDHIMKLDFFPRVEWFVKCVVFSWLLD